MLCKVQAALRVAGLSVFLVSFLLSLSLPYLSSVFAYLLVSRVVRDEGEAERLRTQRQLLPDFRKEFQKLQRKGSQRGFGQLCT